MNAFVSRCLALVVMGISAGCSASQPTQGPKWVPSGPSGGIIGEIYGVVGAKERYETSVVTLISYQTRYGHNVKVLLGPNQDVFENGQGQILANGDFEITKGFAYMHFTTPLDAEHGPAPEHSHATRQCQRQGQRVRGADSSDRVGRPGPPYTEDRIFFTEGIDVCCETVPFTVSLPMFLTTRYTFTYYPHESSPGIFVFAPPASYLGTSPDTDAYAFAVFVDSFAPSVGMPEMYP